MDRLEALERWFADVTDPAWFWLAKRLSANDTGATEAHQVGLYVPRDFALAAFPQLREGTLNPRVPLRFRLDSHGQDGEPNLIYYNNRVIDGGTRDEARLTAFGGRSSALQDPESTASVVILAMRRADGAGEMRGWLSGSQAEDELIEARVGELVPGTVVLRVTEAGGQLALQNIAPAPAPDCQCSPTITALPPKWATGYPSGSDLRDEAVRRCHCAGQLVDDRLLKRVRCEYSLFKVVENGIELPLITSFATVDEFTARALSVLNRRKSRAGTSLELHLETVFGEEHVTFSYRKETENGNIPDFVFPTIGEYHRLAAGDPKLRILAVKTTCKDRWRQVLPEADKVPRKHLFTLDEGISEPQHGQMKAAGLTLVVPASNVTKFPLAVRADLMTLQAFVALVR